MIVDFPGQLSQTTRSSVRPGCAVRRRVVVLGADAAGLTAALHIGAHSLLLDQRAQLGSYYMGLAPEDGFDDCKNTLPMGPASSRVVRTEDNRAERERKGVSAWERQEILDASGIEDEAVVVARWVPPVLHATAAGSRRVDTYSLESLVPLLRGEMRLDTRIVRIEPATRSISLADGTFIVYDKLIVSVSAANLLLLLRAELPNRVRSHQGLMYWLAARDIELLDETTQRLLGDLNPFAAGRRVAETVKRALAQKFRSPTDTLVRSERLFKPRLVAASPSSATAH